MSEPTPLILTLEMDREASAFFDALRRAHFPPERNHLAAHLTLFHHLPGNQEAELLAELRVVAERTAPLAMTAGEVRSLGRGVAFGIESEELTWLRGELAAGWWAWLGAQDRQTFRPHVTVQNKVHPEVARELLAALRAEFAPFPVTGIGFGLWRYLGGPWEPVARVTFGTAPS